MLCYCINFMSKMFQLKYKRPLSGQFRVSIESSHTNCINSFSRSFLFQINAHNILSTHIYHQLPPTFFVVLLNHLQGDNCVTCSRTICFCSGAIKCKIYPIFLKFKVLLHCLKQYYFLLLYLQSLKTLVQIFNCSTLTSVF
jgi:hypothetical protein